jgi:hypothetical protein
LHFKQLTIDGGFNGRTQAAVVDRTQGIELSIGFGDQAIRAGDFGGGKKITQKGFRQAGHIAGDEKVPVGFGARKRGVETPDGSAIRNSIGQNREVKVFVPIHRTNQSYVPGGGLDFGGDLFDQRRAVEGQQSFIASHAAAGSAYQNEPRSSHEMMLATSADVCLKEPGRIVRTNKKVYICFLLALVMLAASPSRAAELSSAATGAPAPVVHKTTVVKPDPRTGKLVRSVVVSSRPMVGKITPPTGNTIDVNAIVEKAAKAHDVDPLLVHSMIKVESNYNVHAVSNKGAQGLMQLTPPTARMLGVSNSFDPQQNIEAGVQYLKYLKDLYKDDRLALAAYNAGPGAVDKYKWIPPYAETQNYVYQVGKRYGEARRAAAAAKPAEVPAVEVKPVEIKPTEVKPAAVETFIDESGRLHLKTTQ